MMHAFYYQTMFQIQIFYECKDPVYINLTNLI